jgi:cytochrome c
MKSLLSRITLLGLVSLLLYACSDQSQSYTPSERPHDPWVFRSVLDLHPRTITMALSKDIWVAYHTEGASLYKTWKGNVLFDGAVYTQAHGPQPISIGHAYTINKYTTPWFWQTEKGDTVQALVNYKGHKFVNDQVILLYDISTPDGKIKSSISELVEASTLHSGSVVFHRKYTTSPFPKNMKLGLKSNVSSIVVENDISTNGIWSVLHKENIPIEDDRVFLALDGTLYLNNGAATDFNIKYAIPTIYNANTATKEEAPTAENEVAHPGMLLINKNDCKTCHNKTLKTVGPSYTDIAKKYNIDDATAGMLIQKIKNGGSGVWGDAAMTPHTDVTDSDIAHMVDYILSLDVTGDGKVSSSIDVPKSLAQAIGIDTNAMLPGGITKIYDLKKPLDKIPDLTGLKPIYGGIKNTFDNIDGSEFTPMGDNFVLTVDGYLKVNQSGTHTLELVSDDGSKLYLHDKLLIDNDGPHGPEPKTATLTLAKGYHPLKIVYYQGGGGKYLSFNWITTTSKKNTPVPLENIYHLPTQGDAIQGMSLPMASASKMPGNQAPLQSVHPAFTLSQARPNGFEPKVGGLDFKKDGSLIVSTWDPTGSVWKITNAQSGDPSKMGVTKIATGLAEPLGVKVVDDTIYVMQKQELTKLVDTNGDGIIDEYLTVCDDWRVSANFHEFGFGLAYKDGYFYATLATAIQPGGASTQPQIPDRGKVVKIHKNTGAMEFIATGLRTPNGIGWGYKDELYVADNQGDWLPASKIVHIVKGQWYGSRSVDPIGTKSLKEKKPVVWLPQDEIGNSPSTPISLNVGPYKGQMIHGEVTHGGIKRVFIEEVGGQYQGAVFRFTQGLEAGVNRLIWGPDGALYVGGIGNPGNWQHNDKKWYGLQKLTYNGNSVFEMLAVRAKANGMEIEFTEPIASGQGESIASYNIRQWYYLPTKEYGGPKMDDKTMTIRSLSISTDRKKVFLEIPGLKADHVVYVHLKDGLISAKGNSLWSTEAWYTMNALPTTTGTVQAIPQSIQANTLSPSEVAAGWKLLFDGKKIDQFRNYGKTTIGSGWVIAENAIHLNAVKEAGKWQAKDAGDIITKEAFTNYEFTLEYKITNCGNSGIIFNVIEDKKYPYVWHTGPEMQILDNICHPDTRFVTHRAGDLYDLIESYQPSSRPAGEWNKILIRNKDSKVSFYLNGYKTVEFTMHTDEWKKMIAKSKFKDMPAFGTGKTGHLALQDHGDKVWFKNIKVRKI